MADYIKMDRTKIVDARTDQKLARGPALDAAAGFHARIFLADHICVGGQAALSVGALRFAYINHQLGTMEAARAVLDALELFAAEMPELKPPYRPLAVCFKGPRSINHEEGHELTWATLNAMTMFDRISHSPVQEISEDPQDPDFGFSWGEQIWFVNAGFPNHPRRSRDYPTPHWIINLQENFDLLRKAGWFGTIKSANAKREMEYQGSTNPLLVDKGGPDQWKQITSVENQPPPQCPYQKKQTQSNRKMPTRTNGEDMKKAS